MATKKSSAKKKTTTKKSTSKKQEKSRFGRLMTILAIGLVIALVIVRSQPPTDEQLLRLAIENGMSKESATLTYVVNESEGSYMALYDTDYSDIMNITASGSFELMFNEPDGQSPSVTLQYVWPGDDIAYVNLQSIDDGSGADYSEFTNRWVSVTSEDASRIRFFEDGPHPVSSAISLGAGSLENVVQAYGEFPDGNFSKDQVKELLEVVDNESVYTLVSSSEVEIGDKTYKKFIVNISASGLKKLNDKVAEFVGESVSPRILSIDTEYFLYIDPKTQTIYRGGQQQPVMDDYRQDTNYNEEFEIAVPENVESYDDFLNSIN